MAEPERIEAPHRLAVEAQCLAASQLKRWFACFACTPQTVIARRSIRTIARVLDIAGKRLRIAELDDQAASPEFWNAGDKAQATVRFGKVGQKNLLLSATPLRRP